MGIKIIILLNDLIITYVLFCFLLIRFCNFKSASNVISYIIMLKKKRSCIIQRIIYVLYITFLR